MLSVLVVYSFCVFSYRESYSENNADFSDSYKDTSEERAENLSDEEAEERPRASIDSPTNVRKPTIIKPAAVITNNPTSLRPKRNGSIKKVDLGAAALYAQQAANNAKPQQQNSSGFDLIDANPSQAAAQPQKKSDVDLLGDMFGGLDTNAATDAFGQQQPAATNNEDFADFSSFQANNPSSNNLSNNDDFSDFQSAFNDSIPKAGISNNSKKTELDDMFGSILPPAQPNTTSFANFSPVNSVSPIPLQPISLNPVAAAAATPSTLPAATVPPKTNSTTKIGESRSMFCLTIY